MKVILLRDLPGAGSRGAVVNVPDGYARNFLLPRGLAEVATTNTLKRIEAERRHQQKRQARQLEELSQIADRLRRMRVTIPARANEKGKLFGRLTPIAIVAALQKQGVALHESMIVLTQPIESLGDFRIPIRVGPDIEATMTLTVVAKHA